MRHKPDQQGRSEGYPRRPDQRARPVCPLVLHRPDRSQHKDQHKHIVPSCVVDRAVEHLEHTVEHGNEREKYQKADELFYPVALFKLQIGYNARHSEQRQPSRHRRPLAV